MLDTRVHKTHSILYSLWPNVMRHSSNLSQNVENDMKFDKQGEIRVSPEKSPCSKSPDISMNDH